ncbi:MAG: hypothetical protein AUJ75_04415 [Candidatus Omnitrophica bacterium CG1_02_49_10]|nr:MAG: hypothetical protein AUJ75_04415 [Candidatus Omnitrophica bacterium CG1_02_49_10]
MWLPVFLYAALIFFLSSRPVTGGLLKLIPFGDKLAHTAEYAVLGVLLARAISNTSPGKAKAGLLLLTATACLLYGMFDEIHQIFVPTRTFEVLDIVSDGLGGFLGALIWRR